MTFEAVYEKYQERTLLYARGYFHNSEIDTEQAVSDVFFRLHQTMQNGTEIRNPSAWLRKAVRNAYIDWLRSSSRRKRCSLRHPIRRDYTVSEQFVSVHKEFEAVDARDTIDHGLSFLNDEERACLKLAYYDQLDHTEAAKQLGITAPAFQQRVSRARRKLHAVLT